MTLSLSPEVAWQPLPEAEWNADAARHLLRRAGWTARAAEVERATREGLVATLERLFPPQPPMFAKPRLVARFEESAPAQLREAQKLSGEDRLRAQRALQDRARVGVQELSIRWLEHAAQPEASAVAKWVLFLSDVYVVSAEKVRSPALLHRHFDLLAQHGFGRAPELTKAISRSPAMVIYLDLAQSQLKSPNENFARELFELFVLGEGNYTEQDIKEAARALTGYRARPDGVFRFEDRLHDKSPKTVFGASGNFTGDDVIDLAYRQPAAATFLPREMVKFYLSEVPLPPAHVEPLGTAWRASGFDLRTLLRRFFGSRLFFAREFRGNLIKSPVQFYLGLVQDLDLDIAPVPRFTLNPLRQMGQSLFNPPNVRGWVGGRQWINSATLTARRQLVEMLFTPIDDNALNADELLEIVAARTNGHDRFTASDTPLAPLARLDPSAAASELARTLLSEAAARDAGTNLRDFLAAGPDDEKQRLRRLRRAAVTLMQSPDYQLC